MKSFQQKIYENDIVCFDANVKKNKYNRFSKKWKKITCLLTYCKQISLFFAILDKTHGKRCNDANFVAMRFLKNTPKNLKVFCTRFLNTKLSKIKFNKILSA